MHLMIRSSARVASRPASAVMRGQWRVRLAMIAAIIAFGTAFPAVKVGLRSFDPGPLALLRFAAASVALGLWLAFAGFPRGVEREWRRLVFLAGANVVAYHLLFNAGQRMVSASAASVLVNTSPICTAVFAVLLLGERPPLRLWLGLMVAFTGAALIAVAERGAMRFSWGAILVLLAAVLQGLSFVVQRDIVMKYGAVRVTAMAVWIGTAVLAAVFGGAIVRAIREAELLSVIAAIYTGVVSTVVGLVGWAFVMSRMPAAQASPYLLAVPIAATAAALFLIAEVPRPFTVLAALMTLAGVALGQGFLTRRR